MAAVAPRKKLSTRGRVLAAGLSIGAAGVLAGAMAISDHTASATPTTAANDAGLSNPSATPYTPSQAAPTQQTPTQQTPAQQTPAQQTPAPQPPPRQTPAQAAPSGHPHPRPGGS